MWGTDVSSLCTGFDRLTNGMCYCFVTDHETMVGVKKVEAGDDLVPAKGRKAKKNAKKEYEEWGGIDRSEE